MSAIIAVWYRPDNGRRAGAVADAENLGFATASDDVLRGVDLSAKVAVVTGASGGLGLETARALAQAGAEVVLAARDPAKTSAALQTIRAQVPGAKLASCVLD